jgi:O-antigen biosynthesis protein
MSIFYKVKLALNVYREDGMRGIWRRVKQKVLNRIGGGSSTAYRYEAMTLIRRYDFLSSDVERSREIHRQNLAGIELHRVIWFIPAFTHPFYGGIYTILRFANYLHIQHGIQVDFAMVGTASEEEIKNRIIQGFPALKESQVLRVQNEQELERLPDCDATIATLWTTAYFVLKFNRTRRKFYFLQDYEPLFYPAGTLHAQVEASYRFGFYALANTPTLKMIYERDYSGQAASFTPCVDLARFHPGAGRQPNGKPWRIFFYGRPDHPRNGFEMGAQALRLVKQRLGSQVEIFAAGDAWREADFSLKGIVTNLGLLTLEETADLYRSCDAGLVLMFTRHPSYLPFELMASGSLVVTNYNPATTWFLRDGENCLLAETSPSCIAERIIQGLEKREERQRIVRTALDEIRSSYADWDARFADLMQYMQGPQAKD